MKDVCAVDELTPHQPLTVRVGNTELVLTKWHDKVYALRNICPHQGQSFACGHVAPRLESAAPGQDVVANEQKPLLICPWHTWGYELDTGRCTTEPRLRVRTYHVEVQDGRVLVDL